MPELPEVETTRAGIAPHIEHQRITGWVVRQPLLRWPVEMPDVLLGQRLLQVNRRGKYLLLELEQGTLIWHLGMSGSLRILEDSPPPSPHDHIDLHFSNGRTLRYRDPRRFGSVHFSPDPWPDHWLLAKLGLEPDSEAFSGSYLYQRARGRRGPVKSFLMDSRIVVGVGNIYANESLFKAGIRPTRAAGRIGLTRYERLAAAVRETLAAAIAMGGTTLRDFAGGDGQPGYFRQTLLVYGREGAPCRVCGATLQALRLGQRATVYCRHCQR
jgi:formamidopyrimidine-DNA glycosylase